MKSTKLALLFLPLLFLSAVYGQKQVESDDIIKVDTALVSVPVIVSDRNGRYIPNLNATDFSVYQDGRLQEIAFFADKKEPLNVALLLDTSLSTMDVIGKIKKAAVQFLYLLEPRDKASVMTFDADVRVLQGMTSNRVALERAVRKVDVGYDVGTVMRDAVLQAAEKSLKNVTGRKAIIVLTDGKDYGSYETANGLLNTLEESDAMVYTVFYKTAEPQPRRGRGRFGRSPRQKRREKRRKEREKRMNEEAKKYLERMSSLTAGRFYKGKVSKLKKHFVAITQELRNQYRLGYYPETTAESGSIHQIRVKVARKKSAVRARSTYRVK